MTGEEQQAHEAMPNVLARLGLNADALPGILFPVAISLVALELLRPWIITSLGMEGADPTAVQSAIVIASVILGLVMHMVSGEILDRPAFDRLYGPAGKWGKTKSRQLLLFSPGYELAYWREEAWRKLADADPRYNDPDSGIREGTTNALRKGDAAEYRQTMQELAWSKAPRNSILPAAALALYAFTQRAYAITLVLALLAILLFVPFLWLRVRYLTNLYRRYCALPVAQTNGG